MKKQILLKLAKVSFMVAFVVMATIAVSAQDDKMMKDDKKMKDDKMMMLDKEKPTVAIIKADWCSYCRQVDPIMKDLMKTYKGKLNFVVFDVTNNQTKEKSMKLAKELNLDTFYEENNKKTSTVAVFDTEGNPLFKTAANTERAAYAKAFDDAIAKSKAMMKN
jgi:thiol-disulfide isomerase/thioredoxin